MLKKVIKFFKNKFVIGFIVLIVFLRVWFLVDSEQFKDTFRRIPFLPDKVVNTIRFFPDYNPFAKDFEDTIPNFGKQADLTSYKKQLEAGSMIVNLTLPFPGDKTTREALVYVPKGYDPTDTSKRYPTLYLLHGSPGMASDWLEAANAQQYLDSTIAANRIQPLIVVFPDGNGGANRDTEFINSADGKELNEDFITQTVVDYIDKNFLTLAEPRYRAIGGASSGGFGAINLGLKHQDIYGYIMSFSGYGIIDQIPLTNDVIQGSQQVIHDNSPLYYIPELKVKTVKTLLISDDRKDETGDDSQVSTMLNNNGFQVDQMSFEGKHTYPFWGQHLPDALDWLNKAWQSNN